MYYEVQHQRIASANRVRAMFDLDRPRDFLIWTSAVFQEFEKVMKKALYLYAMARPLGQWALSVHGVGPVIAAGLLAHIEFEPWHCYETEMKKKCHARHPEPHPACGRVPLETAGMLWRFAGLDDPANYTWEKGMIRPWNAKLKRLCWILGRSFIRLRHLEGDVYGKVYDKRKALEVARNERGEFAPLAKKALESKKIKDRTLKKLYESGKLPDGRLDLRAQRPMVKLFLSHFHHVGYELYFGKPPPKPYILNKEEHVHFIGPPNWPMKTEEEINARKSARGSE
jgi:hypothetical protein